jgi:hypothetical protein
MDLKPNLMEGHSVFIKPQGSGTVIDPGFDPDSFGHKETIEGHTP